MRQQSKEASARERHKVVASIAEIARDLSDKAWCNGERNSLANIAAGCTLLLS